jgi:hypothetical protein
VIMSAVIVHIKTHVMIPGKDTINIPIVEEYITLLALLGGQRRLLAVLSR